MIQKKVHKTFLKWIIPIILLVGLLGYCHGRKSVETKQEVPGKVEIDTIRPKIVKIKSEIKVLADSVQHYKDIAKNAVDRKNYYKGLFKTTYDSLYSLSDSIGKIRLALAKEVKQKQDSASEAENFANSELIVNAFSQISKYQDAEVQYELEHKKDSTDKVQAKIESEKVAKSEFKRGKKVGRIQGVIGTLFAELLLFLGITAI